MKLPPFGVCLPCRVIRVVDGDTVVVALRHSRRRWKIRLLDCWAPERNTPEGRAAKEAAEEIIANASHLAIFMPPPRDPLNLLEVLSLDRLLAHVFVSTDTTLAEALVRQGHATKEKPK